jgi:hypothetical protein
VLVYGREGDDYLMLDPWPYQPGTAKKDYLMKRYSQGMPLRRAIQQVLFYQAAGSSGPIVTPSSTTPAGTTQPQPAPASTPDSGVYARVMDSVTWGLNIRSSKDTSSLANLVIAVPAGTQLMLLDPNDATKVGQNNQWVRVREPGGKEGFAAAWYLEKVGETTPAPATTPSSSPVNEAPASTPTTTPASSPASTPSTTPTPSTSTPAQPQKDKLALVVSDAVGTSGLRLRQSPSMGGTLIKVLAAGTQLTVVEPVAKAKAKIGQANQWIYVREPGGNRGYVGAQFVKLA